LKVLSWSWKSSTTAKASHKLFLGSESRRVDVGTYPPSALGQRVTCQHASDILPTPSQRHHIGHSHSRGVFFFVSHASGPKPLQASSTVL
jgi:hypothetical protein